MEIDSGTVENKPEVAPVAADEALTARDKMLNHLANAEGVYFKSQQIGEPDLKYEEKRKIAETILDQSHSTFLSRFGNNLLVEHLIFFENPVAEESYEVNYYVNKLKSNKGKLVSDVQVKNRRFEAMKRLMSEGEYFSVNEMRKRNPLLFEQLLGDFLNEPELKTTMDEDGHTVAHLLLEQIEQDQVAALMKSQLEAEQKEAESYVTSSDEESVPEPCATKTANQKKSDFTLWGKTYKGNHTIGKTRWKNKFSAPSKPSKEKCNLSQDEKVLLIKEFTSSMFSSFLRGKDEYNYSEIDNNPEYDDDTQVDVDAEEKYFDSESPEQGTTKSAENKENYDDELDLFMKNIQDQVTSENLADTFKQMNA